MYRTAFLPALVALFVAAFALADRPDPARSPLNADAFDGARAFGAGASPAPESLLGMARAFPSRRPGSAGDAALADRVERVLAAREAGTRRPAFEVRRIVTRGRTLDGRGDLVTVVGTRPGLSNRRIVVIAHRDALGRPALAQLSGTAALLELARVFRTRELRKTLVLVSTSGATTGFAGARAWARTAAGGPVDAVLVLGDVAGARIRKPWVVSWPGSAGAPPLGLERTVQAAVRTEVHTDAGGFRAAGQWMRRAVPVTVSEQGPVGADGLPAVLLSESGERGPEDGTPVLEPRLDAFGRAALRAVSAVDAAGSEDEPAFADEPGGIVTLRNVLPDWAVRIVIGALLLPALLAALDGFFRARRRRVALGPWLRWLALSALPAPVAWLWLRALGLTGLLDAPDGPVLPDAFPLHAAGIAALASAALVAAGAWWAARALSARAWPPIQRAPAAAGGLAAVSGAWICGLAALAWIPNPYAAAVLVPAAHLWLFAAAPESGLGGWRAGAVVAAGLALPAFLVLYFGLALGLGPVGLTWTAALAAAGGSGFWTTLLLGGLAAALAGLLRVLTARRRAARVVGDDGRQDLRTRGPLSYAGPGSLGGTESALRR